MSIRLAALACCALVLAACSDNKHSSSSPPRTSSSVTAARNPLTPDQQALNEVAITSCAPDAKHDVEITGTVHNARPGRAQYTVQLTINDKSGKKLYFTSAQADVASDKTAPWTAATSAKYAAGMTCSVASVSRRA